MNKKILFICHDSSRTGAPVLLLSFLHWLKKNGNTEFDVLLLKAGPLRKDFEIIAKTYFIPGEYKYNLLNKVRRRIHPELSEDYKVDEVVNKLKKRNYSIIYGNTIVSLPWLLQFKKSLNVKIVCAIHELSYVIEYFLKKEYVLHELGNADLIIAGSQAVKNNLIEEYKIYGNKIKVVHAFIDTSLGISKSAKILRNELEISDEEIIIGGLGNADLRKGIDMIIPLALLLKNTYPGILFKILWVGGSESDMFFKLFKQDAKKCGVADKIIFIESTAYPDDYINLFDIFLLLSREDPFPLTLLTAATLEKPIIAFDRSGGAPELLNEGAGFLAPYLSIENVAEVISKIYHNPQIGKVAGAKAKEKVKKEFSADVVPEKLYKILNEL